MNCKALKFVFVNALVVAQVVSADKDAFGIEKVYPSETGKSSSDWLNNWSGSQRTLEKAGDTDPQDSQTVMKGRDGITIGSNECIFNPGIPRLFINKDDGGAGFGNIEFTAYANWMEGGDEKSYAGFTMIGRTNHFFYKDDGCNAAGYYMRIWEGGNKEGQVSFQKEYYHGSGTAYSSGVYEDVFADFPKNQWIGMKFVIFTIPGTESVQLELYIDRTDGQNGGDWTLEHAYVDIPGAWNAKDSVPSSCPVGDGDTILGERHSCTLRTDGGEVHWKKASIRHILPGPAGPGPAPSAAPIAAPPTPTTVVPPTPTGGGGGGGTCGGGSVGNGECADGTCCSEYGWCGTSSDHCSGGGSGTGTNGWTVITSDDFEAGWGSFVSGGNDALLYTDGDYYAHQGNNAVEIRDNRDGSVITHSFNHAVSAYSQLRVSFWFIADGMDDSEDFWLQYSTDGGNQWITEKTWTHNTDFENDGFYQEEVLIDSSGVSAIKLRFRCDASNNNDSVYIDEIKFEGKA